MKIDSVAAARQASDRILEKLVAGQGVAYFNLLVDEGDGVVSSCMFTPAVPVSGSTLKATNQSLPPGEFLAVDDYLKIMLLLLNHPKVLSLEYNEKENAVTATVTEIELAQARREEFDGCLGVDY